MATGRQAALKIGPEGGQGVEITGLRFEFNIKKTILPTANEADIRVYNLSENTRALVSEENVVCVFSAGYEDEGGPRGLFWGLVDKVETDRSTADFETRLLAYDGQRPVSERYVTLAFPGGSSIQDVVDAAIDALGFPTGNDRAIQGELDGGFSFSGSAVDALTIALDEAGLKWTIQNELLYIYAEGESVEPEALNLTPSTGLVGPVRSYTDKGAPKWSATSLLYPQLVPGSIVRIEARDAEGLFLIETSVFRGDTFGGEFVAEIEVLAL